MLESIRDFLKFESASGIVLVGVALLALIVANSPLAHLYNLLIDMPVEIRIGPLQLAKPLLLWINDGLMAVFFFLVGLELKREMLEGELVDMRRAALPAIGAVGGMVVPAGIYLAINHYLNGASAIAINGWAIPMATDIAFALGVLLLLGSRVPSALKVFLVSLAIFDDIGAIIVIALFYSGNLSTMALLVAAACLFVLFLLNRRGTAELTPYVLVGLVMWVAVLKSGVHATLAGILLAMFIPMHDRKQPGRSPLRQLEHDLHTTVAFGILPLFAFANAGISLQGLGWHDLLHPVPFGVAAGLFFGKQIGVFAFSWLAIRMGLARLPAGVGWASLYGIALLCGIGFTMSLFISSLAFEDMNAHRMFDERLGILVGTLLSAVAGYLVLRRALPKRGVEAE
ncbi:MAG TPA: Na+/H+ antiporter NhaA [Mariprofundaceae bacterium]|nr:Na+/H+ antiporter NhaA [Mariprofundaceae bacterium]